LDFLHEDAETMVETSNPPHQCPDSEVRMISRQALIRTSESKGHYQVNDPGVVFWI
jgi:hypothetical protein